MIHSRFWQVGDILDGKVSVFHESCTQVFGTDNVNRVRCQPRQCSVASRCQVSRNCDVAAPPQLQRLTMGTRNVQYSVKHLYSVVIIYSIQVTGKYGGYMVVF